MNEELRSATEELETSREELQSINEELTTVNQELKGKVDELGHANSDLQNLMDATAIATVFLDRDAAHHALHAVGGRAVQPDRERRRPAAERPRRPPRLSRTHGRRRAPCWSASCRSSARSAPAPRWLLARLLPYRSGEDRIAGVVLTFVDITARRSAEDALRESETHFRTIVSQAAAGVRAHRPGGPDHPRQRALRADRQPPRREPARHVGVRPGRARRARGRRRSVPADGRGKPPVRGREALPAAGRQHRLGQRRDDDDARCRRRRDGRDRHRPRHLAEQAGPAAADGLGGAAAPRGRERARVRDRVDGPRPARAQLEHRCLRAHRLPGVRGPGSERRHHLHRRRPCRRRARPRGERGARRRARGRRALAPPQGRQPLLGQRRDDGHARPGRRRAGRPGEDLSRPDAGARRRRGARDQPRRARPGSRRQPRVRAPRPRPRATPRTASSPSSRTSCARR